MSDLRISDAVDALSSMDAKGIPICIDTLAREISAIDYNSRKKTQRFIRNLKKQGYLIFVGTVRYNHKSTCAVYATRERVNAGLPDDYVSRLEWHPAPKARCQPISQASIYDICCDLTIEGVPLTVSAVSARAGAPKNNVYKILEKLCCYELIRRAGTIPRLQGNPANLYEVVEP